MADDQHWTWGRAQDFFCNAADCHMSQSGSTMRPHDDHVDVVLLGIAADFAVGRADYGSSLDAELHHDMRFELLVQSLPGVTQAIGFRLSAAHQRWIGHNVQQVQARVKRCGKIARPANRSIAESAEVARNQNAFHAEHERLPRLSGR
jgi:hypothetical protein